MGMLPLPLRIVLYVVGGGGASTTYCVDAEVVFLVSMALKLHHYFFLTWGSTLL